MQSSVVFGWRGCVRQLSLSSGALVFFAAASLAQGVLSTEEVVQASNCVGTVEARSSPVDLSRDIVFAVLADSLSANDFSQFRREFTGLFQAAKDKSVLRLAVISGNAVHIYGPFRSVALLRVALDQLAGAMPSSVAADSAAPRASSFYSTLGSTLNANAMQFGSNWSTLVLVGRWPDIDPDLADYTAGWLTHEMRSLKARLSYWSLSGEKSITMDAVTAAFAGVRLEGLAHQDRSEIG